MTQELTLRALARAVDAKDIGTQDHSMRVARLATRLAEQAGWSPHDCARMRSAGMVHDIGKLAIPQDILTKPDRLDPAEYAYIKRHVEVGVDMLGREQTLDEEQIVWICQHHERPDGRGYPRGLTIDQISEGGAIMALADTFDVMTSARPYKRPMPVADALSQVQALCGRQFVHFAVVALEGVVRGDLPPCMKVERGNE